MKQIYMTPWKISLDIQCLQIRNKTSRRVKSKLPKLEWQNITLNQENYNWVEPTSYLGLAYWFIFLNSFITTFFRDLSQSLEPLSLMS